MNVIQLIRKAVTEEDLCIIVLSLESNTMKFPSEPIISRDTMVASVILNTSNVFSSEANGCSCECQVKVELLIDSYLLLTQSLRLKKKKRSLGCRMWPVPHARTTLIPH